MGRRFGPRAGATLLLLHMASAAATAGAAQILDATDGAELRAEIAAGGVNRVAVIGDRIARVVRAPGAFEAEHDPVTGDLYLLPLAGDVPEALAGDAAAPVTLFIGTEKGFTYAPGAVAITEVEREVAALEKAGRLHAVSLPGAEDALATERTVGEERETIALMRSGSGAGSAPMRSWQVQGHLNKGPLTAGQKEAVTLILSAKDRVVGVQGYAGTGKTTMLDRARTLAQKKGYRMAGLAPSASAVQTLAAEAGIGSHRAPCRRSHPLDPQRRRARPRQQPHRRGRGGDERAGHVPARGRTQARTRTRGPSAPPPRPCLGIDRACVPGPYRQ